MLDKLVYSHCSGSRLRTGPCPGALAIAKERSVARILAVTVAYESDAPGDLQPTLIGLPELRQHCRAERVEDLIDDLAQCSSRTSRLRALHRARSCPSSGVAGDAGAA